MALAGVLVDELARCGVREVVLCPGSRSAPLAYALEEAEKSGRIRLHVRVDERTAGFLALGLAKLSRVPAAVVTTSGTAVANLHPAVLEAHHGQVPLLVLSADRPPELRGTGANQTTVQPGMFGGALRWAHELGAPEARPGQNAAWRSTADRAYAACTGALSGHPGPVHLNVPLREPLVPTPEPAGWPESLEGREGGAAWVTLPAGPGTDGAGSADGVGWGGGTAVSPSPARTLVVVGDLPGPAQAAEAVSWARSRGWPVVAEPFGVLGLDGVVAHGSLLLAVPEWLDRHAPERVVTVGRITLSRAVAALLRRPGLLVETVSPGPDWADPSHVVSRVHAWEVVTAPVGTVPPPGSAVPAPGGAVTAHGGAVVDEAWARGWHEAGAAVAKAAADEGIEWPSGLAVARAVVAGMPSGATLFVGSSNAVRDVDLAHAQAGAQVRVVANRGLAGIDGCVSTAIGLALGSDDPTVALLGDLTFLHDANGLLIGPAEPRPDLALVVANDDGGGIFTLLEPGEPERAASFERLFGTPTRTDLASLCRAHGIRHVLAADAAALRAEVARSGAGLRVVEVRLDRGRHRTDHARLREVAAAALASLDDGA